MIPSCAKRYSLGSLRSHGVRPCLPSRFRMAPSICGDLSTRSRRRKQPNSLPKPRLAFAPSLTTSSFNALAMAGPEPLRLGEVGTAEEKIHGEHNRVRVLRGYASQSIEARSIVVRTGNLGRALRPR